MITAFSNSDFCKTQVDHVQLFCSCHTPWIEETTSFAIYGDKQKEYRVMFTIAVDVIIGLISIASMSYSYSKA